MNTPNPCARCKHLYVDAMVPDHAIDASPDLVGRSCKLGRNLPYTDMPDEVCPKFKLWEEGPPAGDLESELALRDLEDSNDEGQYPSSRYGTGSCYDDNDEAPKWESDPDGQSEYIRDLDDLHYNK